MLCLWHAVNKKIVVVDSVLNCCAVNYVRVCCECQFKTVDIPLHMSEKQGASFLVCL